MSRHAGNASRAARTALSMSSAWAAATSAIGRFVAGSTVGTVAPPVASRHSPPISSLVCRDAASGSPSTTSPPGALGAAARAGARSRTSPVSTGAGSPAGPAGTTSGADVAPPSTSRTPCIRAASSAASVTTMCSRSISSCSP